MSAVRVNTSHSGFAWSSGPCCGAMGDLISSEHVCIDPYDSSLALRVQGGTIIPLRACPCCRALIEVEKEAEAVPPPWKPDDPTPPDATELFKKAGHE